MGLLKAVIVDDQHIISDSLSFLLKQTGKFETILNFYSVDEVKNEMLQNQYDYLFTDLIMPGNGAESFITFARKTWPQLVIVVVSSVTDTNRIRSVFDMGANAYVSKNAGTAELIQAIEKAGAGESFVSADVTERLATAFIAAGKMGITKRELEIIRYVAQGHSIVETASLLNLSEHTVIAHRRNIMEKLGLRSAIEMVKFAYENKIC